MGKEKREGRQVKGVKNKMKKRGIRKRGEKRKEIFFFFYQ